VCENCRSSKPDKAGGDKDVAFDTAGTAGTADAGVNMNVDVSADLDAGADLDVKPSDFDVDGIARAIGTIDEDCAWKNESFFVASSFVVDVVRPSSELVVLVIVVLLFVSCYLTT